ncbi:MAG: hypothetical protein AAF587_24880 [Bacteroidota bacterium]
MYSHFTALKPRPLKHALLRYELIICGGLLLGMLLIHQIKPLLSLAVFPNQASILIEDNSTEVSLSHVETLKPSDLYVD